MRHSADYTNRHFKGQNQSEVVIDFTRKHWIVLLGPLIKASIVTLAVASFTIMALMYFDLENSVNAIIYPWMLISAFVFGLYEFHRFFLRVFHYFMDIVIITNYRVIDLDKSLFIKDSKDAVDLREIQDLRKKQDGLFANFFDYGTIQILVATADKPLTLPFIPRTDHYFRAINQAKRDYISRRRSQRSIKSIDKINKTVASD